MDNLLTTNPSKPYLILNVIFIAKVGVSAVFTSGFGMLIYAFIRVKQEMKYYKNTSQK